MKKIIMVFLALISAASLTVGLSACNKNTDSASETDNTQNEEVKATGKFYTLKEAYENEYITQADLTSIADYHNGGKTYSESLTENVAESIKKAWAIKLNESENNSEKDLTENDIDIIEYYGTYNESVIVIVELTDANYIDSYNPYVVEIANVTFNYSYPRPEIIVWKN